jgi:hypothetical protein
LKIAYETQRRVVWREALDAWEHGSCGYADCNRDDTKIISTPTSSPRPRYFRAGPG